MCIDIQVATVGLCYYVRMTFVLVAHFVNAEGEEVFQQLISFLMINSANITQNLFVSYVRGSILKVLWDLYVHVHCLVTK